MEAMVETENRIKTAVAVAVDEENKETRRVKLAEADVYIQKIINLLDSGAMAIPNVMSAALCERLNLASCKTVVA